MEREETFLRCYMKTISTASQRREILVLQILLNFAHTQSVRPELRRRANGRPHKTCTRVHGKPAGPPAEGIILMGKGPSP